MEELIKQVLEYRRQKMTYDEIGKIMNFTRERIRQMEYKGNNNLK